MDVDQLAANYRGKSDEELLRLALYPEELTDVAQTALADEMARRRLNTNEQLDAARQREAEHLAETARHPGKVFFSLPYGTGRKHYGKAMRTVDSATGAERFRTTAFIALFWLPLVPTGTYLVEKNARSGDLALLERLPLDWEQVLGVWAVASIALLAFVWAVRLLPYVWLWFLRSG